MDTKAIIAIGAIVGLFVVDNDILADINDYIFRPLTHSVRSMIYHIFGKNDIKGHLQLSGEGIPHHPISHFVGFQKDPYASGSKY